MRARSKKSNGMSGIISRFFSLFTHPKSDAVSEGGKSGSDHGMRRVTDDLGNEYLCPTDKLKDRNFVREREKINCFDYDTISKTNFS